MKGMAKIGQELFLTSPVPPSVNHYLSYRTIMKNGRPMAMSYKTAEATKYQREFIKYVQEEVKKQGWKLVTDETKHIYVDTVFYFDRVDKDCNNYFKCSLDAITDTGVVWIDDNVVCERVQRIYYDSQNPRVEFYIHPVDYIGVFENEDEKNEFENKCKTCSRYARNCSILRKALESRVQDEISDGECIKYKEKKEK